jgi:hypothetical protein
METNPFDAAEQNPQQNPFDLAEIDPNKPPTNKPNPIDTFIRGIVSGAASTGKGVLDTYNKGAQYLREHHLDRVLPAAGPMGQLINMTTDPLFTSGYTAISDHLSNTIAELDKMNEGGNTIVKKAGELAGGALVIPPIFKTAELGGSILLDNTIAQNALGKMATIASGVGRSPVQKAIVAGIAKSLPGQILAGVGTAGLIDPASLKTIKGAGMAVGMGVVGSLLDGLNAGIAIKKGAKISPENISDVDALQNAGNNGQNTSKHTIDWWNKLDPNEKILAQKVGGLENIPINELNTSEAHINKLYSDPEVRRGLNELATARYAADTEKQMRSLTGKPKSAAEVRSQVRPEPIDMEIPINNPASAIDELPPETSERLLNPSSDDYEMASARVKDIENQINKLSNEIAEKGALGIDTTDLKAQLKKLRREDLYEALGAKGRAATSSVMKNSGLTGATDNINKWLGGIKDDLSGIISGDPANTSNILNPSTYNNNPNAPTPSGPNNTGGRGGGFGGKPPSGIVGQPPSGANPPNPNNGLPSYSSNIQARIKTQNHSIGQSIQSLMGGIINGIKKITPDNFRQTFINNTHNLTVVEKTTGINGLSARDLPSAQAQLANGSAWQADEFIKGRGGFILDPNTGTPIFSGTPAYQDILRGFSKDQIDAFRRARIAAHVLDERISSQYTPGTTLPRVPGPGQYGAANVDVGIDPNDARLELLNAPKDIVQATTQANQLVNEAGDYAANQGRLDRSTLDWWRKLSPSYTSLQRAFESPKPEPTTGLGRINQTVNKFYKEIRGNRDLQINDPIQNDLDYIRTSVSAANRNRTWMMLREAANADPTAFTGIMEPSGYATAATHQRLFAIANSIQQIAQNQGHNIPQNVALQMAIQFDPSVFDAASNTKLIHNNGLPEVWKISPELAKVANAQTPLETNLWLDLMRLPAEGLKLGITKNPVFPAFHFFRDYFQTMVNTKYGNTLGVNTIKGLVEAIKKGPAYHEFQASGAGGGTLNSTGDLSNFTSATSLRSVIPKSPLETGVSIVTHPIEALSKLYEPLYIAGKLGEYMKARASGADGAVAALAARNVTPDMANVGGSMKALSSMDAFLNPALQHFDNLYQNIKDHPAGFVGTGFASITLPTVALYFLNHDDEQIQESRRGANGSRYWFIRVAKGNDGVIKLPKPWLPGYIFGTLAEEALDKMLMEHPDSFNQLKDALKTEANFSFVPQAVQIPMSLYANKDYYSGIPIVPLGLEQVDPQYQTTATTSNLSKRVSDILFRSTNGNINISPAQLDYVIRSATGSVGSDVTQLSGTLYKGVSGPAPTMADKPLIGKLFARYPTSGAEDVRKFYQEYDKAATFARTLVNLENHNPTKIEEYVTRPDVKQWLEISPVYTETYKQIAEINKTIHDIDNLPDNAVSPEYKRQVTDNLMLQVIQITKAINNAVYNVNDSK